MLRSSRVLLAMSVLLTVAGQAQVPAGGRWNSATIEQLRGWAKAAPDDALEVPSLVPLDRAQAAGNAQAIDTAASTIALRLARLHLLGGAGAGERTGWRINDNDRWTDLAGRLDAALASGRVDAFFASLQPRHPDYARLRGAYLTETDPVLRKLYARNLERWRWLPLTLGDDYLLVNAAAFEARLWRSGKQAGSWRVIVGKGKTPTPVFAATITGVTINPWWDVPASIVRESVGSLVRRNPALARQRGYVWSGGRIRQRPGPGNALGRMKLVMPNPYSVYLHDTPNRDLFGRDVRAFSHGCVRVGDALDLAATLLAGTRTRAEVDALVARGETVTVGLPRQVPVYVTYFTAGMRGDGSFGTFADIYGRDAGIAVTPAQVVACG